MVRYLYACPACCKEFEVEKNMTRAAEREKCPICGLPGQRIFTAPGLSVKGKKVTSEGGPCGDAGHACEGCEGGCCGE